MLWETKEELYLENPSDFPVSVEGLEDIREKIQIFRSMRRSSNSQVLCKEIIQADINLVNWWADDMKKKKKSSSHLYITYMHNMIYSMMCTNDTLQHSNLLEANNQYELQGGFAKLSVLRTSLSFVYRSITHKNAHVFWLG